MKIRKILLATLLVAAFTSTLKAQEYDLAVGLRLGHDSGISARHFFMPNNAVEGIMSFSTSGTFKLTALYQFQQPFLEVDNLDWYVGIGAHIGRVSERHQHPEAETLFLFGGNLIAGVEYVFPAAPFSLSLDWKPSFAFTRNYDRNSIFGFGLSLRFIF